MQNLIYAQSWHRHWHYRRHHRRRRRHRPPARTLDHGGLRRPKLKDTQGNWKEDRGGLPNPEDRRKVYVPPARRMPAGTALPSWQDDRDRNSLRVTNVSEDATEDDLRALFVKFGRVQRLYLGRDRETNRSRGFCFVTYYTRQDAQLALSKLHGYGYDHLILNVEWSKPSTRTHKTHYTGYGKSLPQGLGRTTR